MDASLGFASGVMLAASYWSLLDPAVEMAEQSTTYGENGEFAFIPVAIGFFLGAAFVYAADLLMDRLGIHSPLAIVMASNDREEHSDYLSREGTPVQIESGTYHRFISLKKNIILTVCCCTCSNSLKTKASVNV